MSAQRRLAAILAADVVGFSRLMAADEAGTLAAIMAGRRDILEPLVARHRGRVFKIAGDGVLVEFASAVSAVECAIDLQREYARANADRPEERHIVLRIGVHVGDVMVEGSDLYGDGVNIAARLEALAEPGGIVVSATARDHVGNRVAVGFEDIGAQALKNIASPVPAYRVAGGGPQITPMASATATAGLARGKPTIAVLPFTNMSGDPEQEFFSDGITEDIITELSRFKSLSVVARNTTFQHRGKSVDVSQVGKQLGARYVVEGSLRKLGERVRITAQLIDAATNKHLWAERFDRSAKDLFAVEDEVVKAIVNSLVDRVEDSEVLDRPRQPSNNWSAYDYWLKAKGGMIYGDSWLPIEADLRRAIELDPAIPEARTMLVYVLTEKFSVDGDHKHLDQAFELAQSALALNASGSGPHVAMANLSCYMGRFELAGVHIDRAIALNPNNAPAWITRAQWLIWLGKCDEAMETLEGVRPVGQSMDNFYWDTRAQALFQLRRYQEVIDIRHRLAKADVLLWAHATSALTHAGQLDEARRQVAQFMESSAGATIGRIQRWAPYQQPSMLDHLLEGLRKAGLPE